jgi:hypothetical protein
MTNIVDAGGHQIVKKLPQVKEVKPFGSMLLVEHLTAKQILGTSLEVGEDSNAGVPQAYIRALGPSVSPDVNLEIGTRVLLQGSYVPAPEFGEYVGDRKLGLIEMHNVKGIVVEG